MKLEGSEVLVVGLGRSGVAAARLLRREKAEVVATDSRKAAALAPAIHELQPLGVRFEVGGHDEAAFKGADLIVVSPGVPLSSPELVAARKAGVPILGEAELASRFIEEPLIAITGTNGKSTTTALVGHLLEEGGRKVFVGGNLGRPLSERVLELGPLDHSVVELSSFQLEAVERLRPQVAILTNLSPDHLDRYPGPEAYFEAKRAIFLAQTADDYAILNAGDPKVLELHQGARSLPIAFGPAKVGRIGAHDDGSALVLRRIPGTEGGEERYHVDNPSLRGSHGRENAMAAILAARLVGIEPDAIQAGLQSFPGLPHRLERVRVAAEVEWINDSKATNVESAKVALAAIPAPIHWIAGGLGKGSSYAPLRGLVAERVKSILTIGEEAEAIAAELGDLAQLIPCHSLERAVEAARELAAPGDRVLLSPACASFDQFRSYEERGDAFRELVEALPS